MYAHKPLPALPISMLLGVAAYFYSNYLMNDAIVEWSAKGYFI